MNPRKRGDPLPAGGPEVGWRNLHRRRDRGSPLAGLRRERERRSPSGAPERTIGETEPPRGAPERLVEHQHSGAPGGLRRSASYERLLSPEPREGAPSLALPPEPPRGSLGHVSGGSFSNLPPDPQPGGGHPSSGGSPPLQGGSVEGCRWRRPPLPTLPPVGYPPLKGGWNKESTPLPPKGGTAPRPPSGRPPPKGGLQKGLFINPILILPVFLGCRHVKNH